ILRRASPDAEELQAGFNSLETRLERLRKEHVVEDLDALTKDGLHGIEQIVDLVANLRNFSRLDRSKVASFNVNEGVRATLLIAKPTLRKIDVERHLGDIPSITCSPSQVNQVLLNLVTNSAQAMDKPRGHITVTTRAIGTSAIAIEVEDNGRGIVTEALPRIVDPFYTTKEPGKGTGLGLSIAYKIVAQHGGRIEARSTPGVGTVVTVTLPVEPPAELAAFAEEEAARVA
ncbi:MAG TPA: ATP-binding protein, partial [Usitatibacter sp.]